MRRNSFSLIEILVAMPLIALLLSFLYGHMVTALKFNHALETKYQSVLKDRYFEKKLQYMLNNTPLRGGKKVLSPKSLTFTFDNGLGAILKTQGMMQAHLFFDEKSHELKLTLEKLKTRKLVREEVLLENIDQIEFEYFFENKLEQSGHPLFTITSEQNSSKWAALKLTVTQKQEKKVVFFFTLMRSNSLLL